MSHSLLNYSIYLELLLGNTPCGKQEHHPRLLASSRDLVGKTLLNLESMSDSHPSAGIPVARSSHVPRRHARQADTEQPTSLLESV